MDNSPYLSILIPTKNNENDLIDCLKSICNLKYPFDKVEIVIWDNNSRKQSKQKIKNFILHMNEYSFNKVKFIENSSNFGVYNSRDELLRVASIRSQFILSIDDDIIIPFQLLSELLPIFLNNKSIGIIGPRIIYDDDSFQTAHGAGFINWWLGKYFVRDSKKSLECDYVIGCCMFIRRSVIEQVGGFDRDYYTSHGEIDFCLKAREKGYKTLYYPNVCVRHRVDRGGTQTLERKYYVIRNKLFVLKKNAPLPQKWIVMIFYFFLWPPKIIFQSVRRNGRIDSREIRTLFRAIIDGWLNKTGKRI